MFIRNCLTHRELLQTVQQSSTLRETLEILELHRLDSIPVVGKQDRFVGITGYSRIFKACLQNGKPDLRMLEEPLSHALEWIPPLSIESDFEETLPFIIRHPFVPIVEKDGTTFAGIVKISDIESALASTFGTGIPGTRFLIGVFVDAPHQLDRLVRAIRSFDVNIISIASLDAGDTAARRILLKVESSPYDRDIEKKLQEKGFRVLNVKTSGKIN